MEILEEIEGYIVKEVFNAPIGGIDYIVKAVVPFGSSASGLGMAGGDLDMTICVHPPLGIKRKDEVKKRSNEILAVLFKRIQSGQMLGGRKKQEMEHIDGARVPIITGFVDGVELDISISMTFLVSAQYLSAKFIDVYERYDRRFILLAAYVKKWMKSKKNDENEDYYRTVFPNSCTNVLLVIFFMKQCRLLPNVNDKHEDQLGVDRQTWARVNGWEHGSYGVRREDVNNWKQSNKCDVSLGTLFLLFLDFYAEVDFENDKLCIGTGNFKPKGRRRRYRIVIEDVLDKENMTRSVTQVGMYRKYLNIAKHTVLFTDREKIDDTLMQGVLPDVCSFNKAEMKKLRNDGLHFGEKPVRHPWKKNKKNK